MSTLPKVTAEAAERVSPDRGIFRVGDLAKAVYDAVATGCGALTENAAALMMEGADARARKFQYSYKSLYRRIAANANQTDMAQLDAAFAHFLQGVVGLDDTTDAGRGMIYRLTYHQYMTTIKMHERKSKQTAARAREMRALLLKHRGWKSNPDLTFAQYLGIEEGGDLPDVDDEMGDDIPPDPPTPRRPSPDQPGAPA